jgi:hypothetical protein
MTTYSVGAVRAIVKGRRQREVKSFEEFSYEIAAGKGSYDIVAHRVTAH